MANLAHTYGKTLGHPEAISVVRKYALHTIAPFNHKGGWGKWGGGGGWLEDGGSWAFLGSGDFLALAMIPAEMRCLKSAAGAVTSMAE